jgi:acetyl-CoA carboxylase biotin carboxyl carrier protein
MTDLKTLKQLVKLMADNDLTELDLRDEQTEVHLKRGHAPPSVQFVPGQAGGAMPTQAAATPPPSPQAPGASDVEAAGAAAGEATDRTTIDSPMVGTFFSSPNPDSAPFVSVGDRVDPETVVCLVEAMKVFNEIKAETTGTIAKVLVENGQAVEYGEPLFEITPG